MKKYFFLLTFSLLACTLHAQQSATELVKDLNKLITLYSADNANLLTLFESIGMMEQKANETSSQRIKLSDIGFIKVEKNSSGFSVNIRCADSTHCINLLKNDMTSSSMPSNAFFFTDGDAANTFAKKLEELISSYPSEKASVKAELLKETDLNTSTITQKKSPAQKKKDAALKEEDDQETDVADKSAVKSKRDSGKQVEPAQDNEKTNSRKKRKEDTGDVQNEDDDKRTGFAKKTRNNPEEKKTMDEDATEPVCKQLLAVIRSGKDSKFKDIQGKETNPTAKINESKLKLKGSKRCYLSWYKKERAFIAEYKTSGEHELILGEFEKLQTELENCLEGGWEDIDHSNDEIYANAKEEVKDVEYKLTSDATMPSLRIMISTDAGQKSTLFVRIQ